MMPSITAFAALRRSPFASQRRATASASGLAGTARVETQGSACGLSIGAQSPLESCAPCARKSCSTKFSSSLRPFQRYSPMPPHAAMRPPASSAAPCSLKRMASRSPFVTSS